MTNNATRWRTRPQPPRADRATRAGVPFAADKIELLAHKVGLQLPETVLGAAATALRAGKHIILTGAPGTGKSTLAEVLADAARAALTCTGHGTATPPSASRV